NTPSQPPDDQDNTSVLLDAFPDRQDLRVLADYLMKQEWLQQDRIEPDLLSIDRVMHPALRERKRPISANIRQRGRMKLWHTLGRISNIDHFIAKENAAERD
ncbi:15363_t:CDS:2, partial [Acaulospora colombiana]